MEFVLPILERVNIGMLCKRECRSAKVQKSSFSFSGFSDPFTAPSLLYAPSDLLFCSSSSFHSASVPEVPSVSFCC